METNNTTVNVNASKEAGFNNAQVAQLGSAVVGGGLIAGATFVVVDLAATGIVKGIKWIGGKIRSKKEAKAEAKAPEAEKPKPQD